MQTTDQDHASEARARRAAKRVGLLATKARWRRNTSDNRGGFALMNPLRNTYVLGERYDLIAEDVIEHCRRLETRHE